MSRHLQEWVGLADQLPLDIRKTSGMCNTRSLLTSPLLTAVHVRRSLRLYASTQEQSTPTHDLTITQSVRHKLPPPLFGAMTLVAGDHLLTYRQGSIWTNKSGRGKQGGDVTLLRELFASLTIIFWQK